MLEKETSNKLDVEGNTLDLTLFFFGGGGDGNGV
jgi:hypothetical protein